MLFQSSITNCLSHHAIKQQFDHYTQKANEYQKRLATLPPLAICKQTDDLQVLTQLAAEIQSRYTDVVLLGTGGSTLCPQTFTALAPHSALRIHYADYVDPFDLLILKQKLPLPTTLFLVISKSGSTMETVTQLLWWKAQLEAVGIRQVGKQFLCITDPISSPISIIASDMQARILDHEMEIGGRYAAFTNVGLLPALLVGLDAKAIREGARQILEQPADALAGAALAASFLHNNYPNTVFMPYVRRLKPFSALFRQLWAESLGKKGQGGTPVTALGTIDQHSQLQLYLDGTDDKWFTIITLKTAGEGGAIADHPIFPNLKHHDLGDIQQASQHATIDTLVNKGKAVRVIHLDRLDEKMLGGLVMHVMIETIVTAYLMGVEPFDQPAVEDGKIRVKAYLDKRK